MKQDQETEADPEFQARLDAVLSAMKTSLADNFTRVEAVLTNRRDYWVSIAASEAMCVPPRRPFSGRDPFLTGYISKQIREEILRQKCTRQYVMGALPRLGDAALKAANKVMEEAVAACVLEVLTVHELVAPEDV